MKSIKDIIKEGFFGNIGVSKQANKELIKIFFEKTKEMLPLNIPIGTNPIDQKQEFFKHSLGWAMRKYDEIIEKINNNDSSVENIDSIPSVTDDSTFIYIFSPETLGNDANCTKLPDWCRVGLNLKGTTNDYSVLVYNLPNLKEFPMDILNNNWRFGNIAFINCPKLEKIEIASKYYSSKALILSNCPKLKSCETGIKTAERFYVFDCPSIKNAAGSPRNCGIVKFFPNNGIKYKYADILKYFHEVETNIEFEREDQNYDDKLKNLNRMYHPKPEKTITDKQLKTSSSDNTSIQPKTRGTIIRLTPWTGDMKDAPIWTVNDKNKVFLPDGTEYGRLTRDCSTVYREVNKVLFLDADAFRRNGESNAFDKKGRLVCVLKRS